VVAAADNKFNLIRFMYRVHAQLDLESRDLRFAIVRIK